MCLQFLLVAVLAINLPLTFLKSLDALQSRLAAELAAARPN